MNGPSYRPAWRQRCREAAAAFLEALHESRRRQTAREIETHRHLIDEAKTREFWRAMERSRAQALASKHTGASGFVVLIERARRWMQPRQPRLAPAPTVLERERRLGQGCDS